MFQRVHVKAGETVSVFLYPALTDFARADAQSGRLAAAPGEYRVSFGVPETQSGGGGYLEAGTVRAF